MYRYNVGLHGIAGRVWGTEFGGSGFIPRMASTMWQTSAVNVQADGDGN